MKTPPQKRKGLNDMQLARGRLRGALNETLISEDDNTAGADTGGLMSMDDLPRLGRPAKDLSANLMDSPRSLRHSNLSPGQYISPTRRRKREQQLDAMQQKQKIQAESFVMKLFDRSLDLSKYNEQTSLYPICRAWMANQPRNTSIRSYRDKRSPSPVERPENAIEMLEKLRSGELLEVRVMPAAQETELSKIPPTELNDSSMIERMDSEEEKNLRNASKAELLAKHMSSWKQTKSKWIKHTKRYQQQRYEVNQLIIQELFKP